MLNEWSSDVGKLMGLIEKSCHLIAKVSRGVFSEHLPSELTRDLPFTSTGACRSRGAEGSRSPSMSAAEKQPVIIVEPEQGVPKRKERVQ